MLLQASDIFVDDALRVMAFVWSWIVLAARRTPGRMNLAALVFGGDVGVAQVVEPFVAAENLASLPFGPCISAARQSARKD
jgi:hypothetical protein